MSGKSNDIASQLRGIKQVLVFGAGCLFIIAAANIYYVIDDVRENTEQRLGRTFYEKADTLAKEQEWDELLKLAQDRQKQRPRDVYAFLFAGMAHLHKNEFDQAESSFKQMVVINKSWKKNADLWLKDVAKRRMEEKK
jgi:cytochrome c-type biogenesis protein CcmH/NrfG